MHKRPDVFSGNLLEGPENPNAPEILRPRKGGKPGELVDRKGTVYDKGGNPIGEEPSKELARALELMRRMHPGEDIQLSDPEVQFYVRKFRAEAEQAEKEQKRRGRK